MLKGMEIPKPSIYSAKTRDIVVGLGHLDALQILKHRDEDIFKTTAEGVGLVLTTTHGAVPKGWPIPQMGTARPKQSGLS